MNITIIHARTALKALLNAMKKPEGAFIIARTDYGLRVENVEGTSAPFYSGNLTARELTQCLNFALEAVEMNTLQLGTAHATTQALAIQTAKTQAYSQGARDGIEAERNSLKVCSYSNGETAEYINRRENGRDGLSEATAADAIEALFNSLEEEGTRGQAEAHANAAQALATKWRAEDEETADHHAKELPETLAQMLKHGFNRINYFEVARHFIGRVDDSELDDYRAELDAQENAAHDERENAAADQWDTIISEQEAQANAE